jgi:diaminopimelate decarboxylase
MKLSRPILDRIAAGHGSSFYIIDPDRFADNFDQLTTAFQAYYPRTTIAYSYKTNYIPRFCQIVDSRGGFAEIVSIMEYRIAMQSGIVSDRIMFNGPLKERAHLEEVLASGCIVNADSLDELRRICQVAEAFPERTVRIGLRCNFDVGDGVLSRFGFDVDGEELAEALRLVDAVPNISVAGLHCHFATRTLACWEQRTQGMLRFLTRWISAKRADVEFVSLGGGMYGRMSPDLQAQFSVPIPTFEDYAAVAAKPFAAFFDGNPTGLRPALIVEPGTALVADAMRFAAKVVSIKNVRGKPIATLAGSIYNVNPTPNRKNMPIEIFASRDEGARGIWRDMDFGGYTCIESDYLYRGFEGELGIDDFVVFGCVGAYSVVMKPPFILPNSAILEIVEDGGDIRLIKRREEFDDLFATYSF